MSFTRFFKYPPWSSKITHRGACNPVTLSRSCVPQLKDSTGRGIGAVPMNRSWDLGAIDESIENIRHIEKIQNPMSTTFETETENEDAGDYREDVARAKEELNKRHGSLASQTHDAPSLEID